MSLEAKRALVTGGSAGLGAAIALQLAQRGARVAINYANSKERAEATLKSLPGTGHVLVQGDAFSHEGVDAIVKGAIKELGGLDLIASNAGWTKFASWADLNSLSDDDWMGTYKANVLTHLWVMQAAQEELKKNKGAMVISASIAGIYCQGSSMAYSVAKAGSLQMTKVLAKSCGPEIRVNAVAPGLMLTEWGKNFSESVIEHYKHNTALKSVPEVSDVADAVVHLLENKSITGVTIEVSSGLKLV